MNISDKGIAFIKKWEGLRLEPYKDVGGKESVGYGHLVREGQVYGKITEQYAEQLLRGDLLEAEHAVNRLAGKCNLTQGMYDALVSFTFNLGGVRLEDSTLLGFLAKNMVIDAAQEFPRWCRVGDKKQRGLLKRRLEEALLFLS